MLQPRCEHPDGPIRSWETDSIDVLEFAGEVKEISELANSDDAPLAAGDHCRFCKASGTCPELRDSAFRAAKTEFNKVDNLKGADPAEFSRKEIGEILDAADVLDQWIKAVREHAHRMAEVGETPDGWKLVDKRAVRKWAEDGPTEMFLTEVLGQSDSDIFSYKIKSPAQIEKIVGKGKIDHLVIAESSGTKLVRLSAAGQPVIPRDPKADFSTVET